MKHAFKRLTSAALALVMAIGIGAATASAAAPYKDGAYTAKITFLHENKEQNSMCNVLFDNDADVKISGENTEIRFYAAYPVPAFAGMGADGTVKDVQMTLDGTTYTAASDITSKPVREFDETNPAFGVEAGKSLSTQVLTLTIPTAKLDALASGAPASGFVNVLMNTTVKFRIRVAELTAVAPEVTPNETSTKGMNITAEISAPAPTYSVTIPESVSMGTLSREQDTVTGYKVEVAAENMGAGYVEVSAPTAGVLTSAEHELAFANSFGTQKASAASTLNGEFTVTAEDVAAAAAGNYTGTATFTIRYFAG